MTYRDALNPAAVAATYWSAATGGRFFTRWSGALSFVVAGFVLVPLVGGGGAYRHAVVASILVWCLLAVVVGFAALAERNLTRPRSRGVLVTATLVVVAAVRPALNEAMLDALYGQRSGEPAVSRVLTNLLVAFTLFSAVAIITASRRRRRAATARLADALGRLDGASARIGERTVDVQALLGLAVDELRASRETMLARPVDFDAVRDYSELVRRASHRFEELAAEPDRLPDTWTARHAPISEDRRGRLAPPPLLWVGLLYALLCTPFILTAAPSLGVVALAIVAVVGIDLVAGAALRLGRRFTRSGGSSAALFLIVWLLAGVVASGVARLLLPGAGAALLVPLFALPAIAVVLAVAIDAVSRARMQEENSTRELARATAAFAAESDRLRGALRRAGSILHGRVQGRCVIFAALADEEPPTPEQTERFRVQTDAALDEVQDVFVPTSGARADTSREVRGERMDAFTRMLAGWRPVLSIETRIADAAVEVIQGSGECSVITEVVNEALVNAVKHSGAHEARIDVSESGDEVFVRVASPGRLPRPVVATRPFAGSTLLYQDGVDVVLEATIPAAVVTAGG